MCKPMASVNTHYVYLHKVSATSSFFEFVSKVAAAASFLPESSEVNGYIPVIITVIDMNMAAALMLSIS